MSLLHTPVAIGSMTVPNRLYRAPLLECAGDGPDAPERLVRELEPAAASGAGLVCQGATPVHPTQGHVAPNMTHVGSRRAAARLAPVPEAVHAHGGRIVAQLDHGGLRSMETWHRPYREAHRGLQQLAVSDPPPLLRLADRFGLLDVRPHVLSTDEVYALAADFGRSAGWLVDAGYDGIHIAGANMGIVQQFCSPYYNRRDDEFGGSRAARLRFLELVHDEVRDRVGDVPLLVKVPAETNGPPGPRRHIDRTDAVRICQHLVDDGYDAVVPVECSPFWDTSIARGAFPERAWATEGLQADYAETFGGDRRADLVRLATLFDAADNPPRPAWNARLCRAVRRVVDVPVLCEGGIRERTRIDGLLGDACDMVGLGRPFYAEPRLPARLLADAGAEALCANCNNCLVPQATGAPGMCRTPSVLQKRGELQRAGAYDPTD